VPFLSVSYHNFRNIHDGTIDLLSKEVYLIGENGQGKSNILESLYISAYGSSFRTRVDSEIITNTEQLCKIKALYTDNKGRTQTIGIQLGDGKKRIEKNTKLVHDRKELVDTIPCIVFNHDDLDFVAGSPDRKRFFIDQSLSLFDGSYIDVFRKYKKILKSRNLLLKDRNSNVLDAVDYQLAETGLAIIEKREKTIFSFNQVFSKLYAEVSGIAGVTIDYSPVWKFDSIDKILVFLSEKRTSDIEYGMTSTGPHRDRIRFVKDKKAFVPTASTGQRRLLSLILRSAQAQYYTDKTGKLPVLLMDDVLLELDPEKRQRMTTALPEYDQLFCTFLPGEPYTKYQRSTTKVYFVKDGAVYDKEF
jgi:DNA replication and repair protein RecF